MRGLSSTSKNSRRQIVLVSIAGIVASLLVLEGSLRVFRYQLLPFVSISHQPCIYTEDGRTGYRYSPNANDWIHRNFEMNNFVRTNSAGFHDVEHPPTAKGNEPVIVAIGDSFTASLHVPIDKTWTQILETELGDSNRDQTLVINLGLDGTGTDVHLTILKDYLSEHEPEIAILAFYKNDINDIKRMKRYRECYESYVLRYNDQKQKKQLRRFVDDNKPSAITRWLFEVSYTARVTAHFLLASGKLLESNDVSPRTARIETSNTDPAGHELDQLLSELKGLSERRGFRLLVIPVPTKKAITRSLEIFQSEASAEVLADLELVDISPVIEDLLKTRGKEYPDLFWRYDGHFNEKGNEFFGIAVAKVLEQQLLPN